MPNNAIPQTVEENFDDIDEFGPEDYGFIIGPDGSLKTVLVPENLMEEPPEEVQAILNLFGINNIHQVEFQILH